MITVSELHASSCTFIRRVSVSKSPLGRGVPASEMPIFIHVHNWKMLVYVYLYLLFCDATIQGQLEVCFSDSSQHNISVQPHAVTVTHVVKSHYLSIIISHAMYMDLNKMTTLDRVKYIGPGFNSSIIKEWARSTKSWWNICKLQHLALYSNN